MRCRKALGVLQVLFSNNETFPLLPILLSAQTQNRAIPGTVAEFNSVPAYTTTTVLSQTLVMEQRFILNSAKRIRN